MGKCPFCATVVPDETLMYGGACPKCFGEIPGEEAATDPGAEVRAKQAVSDSRRALWKTLIPFLLAIPALGALLLLAVGFLIYNRDPYVEPINFDELSDLGYDVVELDPEPEEQPAPVAHTPTPKAPRPVGAPTPTPEQVAKVEPAPSTKAKLIPSASGFAGVDIGVTREAETLSEPGEILTMIQKVMRKEGKTLAPCYQAARMRNPQLEGRWKASFRVEKNGRVKDAKFVGRKVADAEMEKCLADVVRGWRFGKISRPQPVQKSWRFRP